MIESWTSRYFHSSVALASLANASLTFLDSHVESVSTKILVSVTNTNTTLRGVTMKENDVSNTLLLVYQSPLFMEHVYMIDHHQAQVSLIYMEHSQLNMTHCVLESNWVLQGTPITLYSSNASLSHCQTAGNSGAMNGGLLSLYGGEVTVSDSIVRTSPSWGASMNG